MNNLSSRYIDLTQYKTLDILIAEAGSRAKMKPANRSKTQYICECPFHNEKTPSCKFYFHPYLRTWGFKCFGCGRSGDIFTYLMIFENWTFWDTLAYLKRKHGCSRYFAGPSSSAYNPAQIRLPFEKDVNGCSYLLFVSRTGFNQYGVSAVKRQATVSFASLRKMFGLSDKVFQKQTKPH